MRFKKGSKVEVMNKKEVSTSWRVAEIISGNGHTYNVKYDCYSVKERDVGVEKVSRKLIRPCPPAHGVDGWSPGDVAEAFYGNSWKTATVLKVWPGDHYLVRPLGSAYEFSVPKLSIRVPLSWEDNKWILIRKSSGSCEDGMLSKITNSNCYQKSAFQIPLANAKMKEQGGAVDLPVQNGAGLKESHVVSSKMLKRVSPCSPLPDAYIGKAKKFRAVEKGGRCQSVVPAQLLEKVDAVAYPREILGEKYMQSSFNNSSNGYHKMERTKSNVVVRCSLARVSDHNNSDTDECSIGSCSVVGWSPTKFSSDFVATNCQEADTLCSDAESFHNSQDEEDNFSPPPEKEVAASIRRLELHAYRSTLEALYASGPLSWEKEAVLTNLRINLHISNDEHLIEIRNLISPGAGYLN